MLSAEDVLILTSQMTKLAPPDDDDCLRFYEVRVFLKMTQAQMAKKLGVSPRTVYNWETGRREPTIYHRQLLERKLHLSPLQIYRMFPPKPPKRTTAAGAAA